MLLKITNQSNYLAKVFRISGIRKHTNADRLQCVSVDGFNTITGLDAKDGMVYVFFPAECQIHDGLLAFSNSYTDHMKNADKEKKGFVQDNRRIKTISLRSERSEGYCLPALVVEDWLKTLNIFIKLEEFIDKYFDTIDKTIICNKYVIPIKTAALNNGKQPRKKARESKLIENQFKFHYDTDALQRNIHKLNPNDLIWVSSKYHGTSAVFAHVLCKKPLTFVEKILKMCKVNIVDTAYDYVYSSRSVVKNQYADKQIEGFYKIDVWGNEFNKLKDKIPAGVTLYGEVVGFTGSGGAIQAIGQAYDYGCLPGCSKFVLYRATFTNDKGQSFEFSYPALRDFAERNGIELVETLYYGKAKDMFPELSIENHWNQEFINMLSEKYLEKDCHLCKNTVPYEGVVLKIDGITPNAYKLKSFKFRAGESKQMDSGEADIESSN